MTKENDETAAEHLEFTDEELFATGVLPKEILAMAADMPLTTARFLIDTFYTYQDERIGKAAQIREARKAKEPTGILEHFFKAAELHEKQAGRLLTKFAKSTQAGRWACAQKGIGGVITAGLFAHVDMEEAVTPSHLISHAGLNPEQKWEKGQKRPFSARLKALTTFKMGECLVKVQNREGAFYGNLFRQFKQAELAKNDSGKNSQAAWAAADDPFKGKDGKMRRGTYGTNTDAWEWVNACFPAGACQELADIPNLPLPDEIMELEGKEFTAAKNKWRVEMRIATLKRLTGKPGSGQPMLPPSQVHARARRRVVKLFLQHFWEELFVERYNQEPPEPFVFAHMGHFHKIERPAPSKPDPSKPPLPFPRIARSRMPGYQPKVKPKKRKDDEYEYL